MSSAPPFRRGTQRTASSDAALATMRVAAQRMGSDRSLTLPPVDGQKDWSDDDTSNPESLFQDEQQQEEEIPLRATGSGPEEAQQNIDEEEEENKSPHHLFIDSGGTEAVDDLNRPNQPKENDNHNRNLKIAFLVVLVLLAGALALYPTKALDGLFGKGDAILIKITLAPSSMPSMVPSATPSFRPTQSVAPSLLPSASPSDAPSHLPSSSPSLSMSPTTSVQPSSAPTILPLQCPSAGEEPVVLHEGSMVRLYRSDPGTLCYMVLSKGGEDAATTDMIPVLRSYNGRDWENYATTELEDLDIECQETNNGCIVDLPSPNESSGAGNDDSAYHYRLMSFESSLSKKDEMARFLEQATFGATRADIQALLDLEEEEARRLSKRRLSSSVSTSTWAMGLWIQQQLDPAVTQPTLHREFFRRHAIARFAASSSYGLPTHPCQANTMYRKFAFTHKDKDRFVEIQTHPQTGKKLLLIDSVVMTVMDGPVYYLTTSDAEVEFPDGSYQICIRPWSIVGGRFRLSHFGRCSDVHFGNDFVGNPPIQFDDPSMATPNQVVNLDNASIEPADVEYYAQYEPAVQRLLSTSQLTDSVCKSIVLRGGNIPIVFGIYQDDYWVHDPRFVLQENTLENPMRDEGGLLVKQTQHEQSRFTARCASVPRTFLNEESCQLSRDYSVCGDRHDQQVLQPVTLTPETIISLYDVTADAQDRSYVFAVSGLRVQDDDTVPPPCQPSTRSRWMATDKPQNLCGQDNPLSFHTAAILTDLIYNSLEGTDYVRDIVISGTGLFQCDSDHLEAKEIEVFVYTKCWKHTHPDNLSVFDTTPLVIADNPFIPVADLAGMSAYFPFPAELSMADWHETKSLITEIGQLGQSLDIWEFSDELQTREVLIGLAGGGKYGSGAVVCGSPGEIANDLSANGEARRGGFDLTTTWNETSTFFDFDEQRVTVWTAATLQAPDQLRQRVAWALFQMFPITGGLDGTSLTEDFTGYYDIFIRNAENYGHVLTEISFNVLMANMLTFIGSKSTGYQWRTNGLLEYPDENFARELLQLFTIGLYELDAESGKRKTDSNGKFIRTYSNDDIMELSRAWTGFIAQGWRGNSMAHDGNRIDPMAIDANKRDSFPKMLFEGRYIGHGYPLCADLPERHYLARGAKYRLLGSSTRPELQSDPVEWGAFNSTASNRFLASKTAKNLDSLYAKLCDAENKDDPDSQCRFPPIVTLEENLDCHGIECDVNTVRIIEVEGGIFYEYQQLPCVYQAFYKDAKLIKKQGSTGAQAMCADPRIGTDASTACCFQGGDSAVAFADENFWGERVKYSEAQARCSAISSFGLCSSLGALPVQNTAPYSDSFYWLDDLRCEMKVKLDMNGKVAVVHSTSGSEFVPEQEKMDTDEDSKTFFRVQWSNKELISNLVSNCDENSECSSSSDGYCLCNVDVLDEAAFQSPPTRREVLDLAIGSFHPLVFDTSYQLSFENGVSIYNPQASVDLLSTETIFEVTDDFGRLQLRRNLKSSVRVLGTSITFTNPVHFMSLAEPTTRDALYETNAVLNEVFYHENTAPFVATRLAQRFGFSNPPPSLMKSIITAFKSGMYVYQSGDEIVSFGQGNYGDITAIVAAILLNPDTRNPELDGDPFHGSMKEPLLKVLGVMRALEFKPTPEYPFPRFQQDLQQAIGQQAYEAPSIFSFFVWNHQPAGPISEAGLFSPESEVYSFPNIIKTVNGIMAMARYGFDRCFGGFGKTINWHNECQYRQPGAFVNASGVLSWEPDESSAEHAVDQLATIMTSGRLDSRKRDLIKSVFANESDKSYAVIKAQQLVAATAEFHTTGMSTSNSSLRPRGDEPEASDRPYKALVVLMLRGGVDSYNMIVPEECEGSNSAGQTVREQYDLERGKIRLEANERSVIIDVAGQPCSKFAIHERLPLLKELYDDGDLSFFMNAGVLNEPVTREDFESKTVTQLFAHNAMQHELQKVDPFDDAIRTGLLGRVAHVLNSPDYGYHARALAINNQWSAVNGDLTFSLPPIVMSEYGAERFNSKPESESFDPRPFIEELNGMNEPGSSVFGETWSHLFTSAMDESDFLADALENVTLSDDCGSRRLNMAVKLMETRSNRGSDRDLFFLEIEGWDHHMSLKDNLDQDFRSLNEDLECFVRNVKEKGLSPNVTLVATSDFGRTLTPNTGEGSDHGWGGHYFAMGGALKSHQVFGDYPTDLTANGPLNTGRGRMIPTLSWESMWTPVMEWLGVRRQQDLDYILPNANRTGARLIRKAEMFEASDDDDGNIFQ